MKLDASDETPPDSSPGQAALSWAVNAGKSGELERRVAAALQHRRARRRRAIVSMAAAACVMLAAMVGWKSWTGRAPASIASIMPRVNSPIVSLPAQQVLPDGSVVELNAGAEIDVQFDAHLRRVVLRRGEAHFEVKKDPARTFVVVANGVEVRAVGTAFAVQLGGSAVEIVVTEGTVAVDKPEIQNVVPAIAIAPMATVGAGNRVVIALAAQPAPAVVPVSAAEMSARLAWRVPRVEFSGTPLAEVIPMFNRHSRETLVLDPALSALQMSGMLRANNVDALLLLLKNEFGIEAERRAGGNEIHLRRR